MREWLKDARKERNMTQVDAAKAARISRSYYTNIENGSKTPAATVAIRIADVLGVKWTLFFEDECSLGEQNKIA